MTTVSMMTAVAEPDPAAPAPPWVLGRGRVALPSYSHVIARFAPKRGLIAAASTNPAPHRPADGAPPAPPHRARETLFSSDHRRKTVGAWVGAMENPFVG